MVLNPDISQLSVMIKYCLEPEIYSFRQLKALQRELMKSVQVDYPIHLKVETGMHRLGFDESQIDGLIEWLKSSPEMKVASIFSHLASSSLEGDVDFTKIQIAQFKDIVVKIENDIGYTFIKHILNSSGIINFPEAQFDMVRLGIGLYGIGHKQLQNCSALKSMISQIKNVSSGQSIGYDRAFMAEENIKIAIIPIGYAD
jgi:alanine racemase